MDKRSLVGYSPQSHKRVGHNLVTKKQVYYSVTKRNIIESVEVMWMNPEPVIQTELSQKKEKQTPYINAYIWNLEKWN